MNGESSYSELISSYLDGELDAGESSMLLYAIAGSPELQAEMHDMLALRRTFATELMQPTPELTRKVFQQTVLAGNAAERLVSTASTGAVSRRLLVLLSMASAVVGSLLTVAAVTLLAPNEQYNGTAASETIAPLVTHHDSDAMSPAYADRTDTIVKPAENAALAVTSSPAIAVKRLAHTTVRLSDSVHDINGISHQSVNDSQPLPAIDPVVLQAIPSVAVDSIVPVPVLSENPLYEHPAIIHAGSITSSSNDRRFSLAMRGFAARSYPDFDLDPLTDPPLNNIALGLFYRLAEHHAAGIEVGQEHFLQEYSGVRDGDTVRFEQNYLALWGGIAWRYHYGGIDAIGGIEPVAEGMIGGMQTGPLGRLMLGLRLEQGNLAFTAGAEGTLALYRYQREWFSSRKLGVTYGVSIQF